MSLPHNDIDPDAQQVSVPFRFTGTTEEYFRIWVVNVFLSIATLGLYSPWAKVRRKTYFHRNTFLLDDSFDYHADPVKILKGRLLVAPLFIGYTVGGSFSPTVGVLFGVILLGAFPWIVVRSLMFNAAYSSFRNVRFRFDSNYARAYKVFLFYGFLAVATLGLFAPFMDRARRMFVFNNHAFGRTQIRTEPRVAPFYKGAALAVGTIFAVFVTTAVVLAAIALATFGGDSLQFEPPDDAVVFLIAAVVYLGSIGAYVVGLGLYNGAATRETLQHATLGPHRFSTQVTPTNVAKLYATNFAALLCTLGLATPWVSIRTARFWADHISLNVAGSLDAFTAEQRDGPDALGEEFGEFFDIDFGF